MIRVAVSRRCSLCTSGKSLFGIEALSWRCFPRARIVLIFELASLWSFHLILSNTNVIP